MQTPVEDFFNFTVLCQSFKVVLRDSLQIFQCLLGFFLDIGCFITYHKFLAQPMYLIIFRRTLFVK